VKGTGAENTDGFRQSPWWPATVAIVAAVADGRRRTVKGHDHNVGAAALAPVLIEFFN
jgi:hypothetical protein